MNKTGMMGKRSRARGFSLVELMVAVVVLAILAAVAMPVYTGYIQRSHRSSAQALLAETAQYMERYYTVNNSYAGATIAAAVVPRDAAGSKVRYNISFSVAPDADKFTLQAAPANAQVGDKCSTMTLSSTGAQTAAESGCW